MRECVGAHAELCVVVKANAYGHGLPQIVEMAEKCGIHYFAIASSYEALSVLAAKDEDSKVIIMGILYDDDLPWAIENDIEFYVFDLPRLQQAATIAKQIGKPAKIHLEVETGGNRTGLDLEQLPAALDLFKKNSTSLSFEGLCSHLAGAETLANGFRINKQIEQFKAVCARFQRRKIKPLRFHLASSAAAMSMPETAFDLVRVGTVTYGLWPSPDIYNLHLLHSKQKTPTHRLHRVFSWKTDVMHLKKVPHDSFVGYGTSYQAFRDMTTAVIPLGYANGYPREMSNRGHVLIRGKKAPVVGLINMNMFIVDVTHIPGVEIGDEVVLVGRQKNNVITLHSFSEFSSALNTEFVSRLPAKIPRHIVR